MLALVLVMPRDAAAQATTADGARALADGDYETAVRILRPLAENTAPPDPLAQFFTAMLHASGHGDRIEACALYLIAATSLNPLASQSRTLGRILEDELGRLCVERLSPDYHALPSTTFTLAPDHSITLGATGGIVSYGGAVKQTLMTIGRPGVVYFPPRHIALNVTAPVAVRRHFIQLLSWRPDAAANEAMSTLDWVLFEVVGADLSVVANSGGITSIIASPLPMSLAVEALADVVVGATGEAEWIILTNPPRRGVIPFGQKP